jgi:hypothetical protein
MAYARRTYLIDRSFQLKYTFVLVGVGAVLSLLFGAMLYRAHQEATQMMELPDPYQSLVAQQDDHYLLLVAGVSLAMALTLGLCGVVITHRVAGPIYVLGHYMNVLGEGRYPLMRPLRKKDEFKALFESFDGAVAAMKDRDRSDGQALQAAVTAIEAAAEKSPELASALMDAAAQVRSIGARRLEASSSADPATPGQLREAAAGKPAA